MRSLSSLPSPGVTTQDIWHHHFLLSKAAWDIREGRLNHLLLQYNWFLSAPIFWRWVWGRHDMSHVLRNLCPKSQHLYIWKASYTLNDSLGGKLYVTITWSVWGPPTWISFIHFFQIFISHFSPQWRPSFTHIILSSFVFILTTILVITSRSPNALIGDSNVRCKHTSPQFG